MTRIISALVLSLSCSLFFASFSLSRANVSVGATSKWIFGIDDNLSVVWKIPNEGYSVACGTDDYFVAINGKSIPPIVFIGHVADGKKSSSFHLSGIPLGWGISSDSAKGAVLSLRLDIGDSIRTEFRELVTGRLQEIKTAAKKDRSHETSVCPLSSPHDTLTFSKTSRHLCALSPDLSLIWHQNLKQGEHLAMTDGQYGLLATDWGIRVLDKNSGSELWSRSFDKKITGISSGATWIVSFRDGHKDTLEMGTGISKAIGR